MLSRDMSHYFLQVPRAAGAVVLAPAIDMLLATLQSEQLPAPAQAV